MRKLLFAILMIFCFVPLTDAKPSGNMAKTTRYFTPSGYAGSARTYDYGTVKRSYYYNSKGVYQGQSVERTKK